jgi:two-component system, chemotaxis family, CheB/CheR fusion protein
MTVQADPAFESLLEFLKGSRGFDFTGYKRSTLLRRVSKRMQGVGIEGYDAYRAYLEAHPAEFDALFNTILINVTAFFRDADAWKALRDEVIPALLERKGAEEPVRVWSAGCASGEETYTLVMLLAEALGMEGFRDRAKIYATDLDEEALAHARQATYAPEELVDLPEGFAERYFERVGNRCTFRPELRRQVIFGRHDLVQDPPISQLDLLVCRNVLMYFNAEVQGRVLARFHFGLRPEGVLFLGRAEMMRSHGALFAPLDLSARLFRKAEADRARERLLLLGDRGARTPASQSSSQQIELRDAAMNALPAAQLVLAPDGTLLLANDAARRLFDLALSDLGRPLQDLRVSYRPVELRSRIEQVIAERHPVVLSSVRHTTGDGDERCFDVQLSPLPGVEQGTIGISVSFFDVTRYVHLQGELETANEALETAFEELQSGNEEMETTNEELQSTVEELETTNEELQSTNEELETMNEELQSTNEEMETLNDELQQRTEALNVVNASLNSVLTSLRAGVVVVDRGMTVQIWNRSMEELWGLRSDEVQGQPLLHLDIGLPTEQLRAPIRALLEGRADADEMMLTAVNRRGRPIECRVALAPLLDAGQEIHGAVVLVEEWTAASRPAVVESA